MSDILSPEEINALLNASRAAESLGRGSRDKSPEHQIRLYDFSRPDRFSKDHMRTLNGIHTKYATMFSVNLEGLINTTVEAALLAVDLVSYREYCSSVPEGTLFCDVRLDPLTSAAIFEFNPSVVCACIDGLTGGGSTGQAELSELTEIDKTIMKRIVGKVIKEYEEAWGPYVEITVDMQEATGKASYNHRLLPTEHVLVCGYEVSIGQVVGMMSICIPAVGVEAILPNLAAGKTAGSAVRQSEATLQAIEECMQDIEVECRAFLGRTTLTMDDIINLQEGDIVRLDKRASETVEFWVGEINTYIGEPGRTGDNVGIKITDIVKPEDEDDFLDLF